MKNTEAKAIKAKIGNIIVDVWKINRDDSESDYASWLKSAIEKNLVGWSDELIYSE